MLDQDKCRYTPRVLGVRVGQALQIRNSDPLLHNVRSNGVINQAFNKSTPVEGMSFNHTFATREVMVPFKCDVHGWMSAWVGVLDHPYFGTTAPDGRVVLGNLPPGTYTIEAWHESLGTQTRAGHHRRQRIEGCQLLLLTLMRAAGPHAAQIVGAKTHSRAGDFVSLTKPRLNFLVLLTTAAAYSLGAGPDATIVDLAHTLAGTFLVAGGAAALNQVWERATDRLMRRTQRRPMAAMRMTAAQGTRVRHRADDRRRRASWRISSTRCRRAWRCSPRRATFSSTRR